MALIETDRLTLRGMESTDAQGSYYEWMNDFSITQYLECRFSSQPKASLEKFVNDMVSGPNLFLAICLKENKTHIGNIKVGPIHPVHRFAEVGILLGDPNEWGKGYATEAISAVTKFCFNEMNVHKLVAGCYGNNMGSAKAFVKAGCSKEATLKKHFYSHGEWVDHVLLARFRD